MNKNPLNTPLTATALSNEYERISAMTTDQINLIEALIPYLKERQMIARDWERSPHPGKIEIINSINEEIKKILGL